MALSVDAPEKLLRDNHSAVMAPGLLLCLMGLQAAGLFGM
jgi:hypothetical protein